MVTLPHVDIDIMAYLSWFHRLTMSLWLCERVIWVAWVDNRQCVTEWEVTLKPWYYHYPVYMLKWCPSFVCTSPHFKPSNSLQTHFVSLLTRDMAIQEWWLQWLLQICHYNFKVHLTSDSLFWLDSKSFWHDL